MDDEGIPRAGRDGQRPGRWTTERSRHVHRDRWVSLRADACRTEAGVAVDPYYVLEYPDWAAVVTIDEADRLVLVEQYRHGVGVVALGLPGGAIDAGEGAIAAGRRELAEETGFEAAEWRAIATLATNPASLNNWCHVLLATGARRTARPADMPAERIATRLVPIDEAVARARAGEIVHGMDVAALMLALAAIGRHGPAQSLSA